MRRTRAGTRASPRRSTEAGSARALTRWKTSQSVRKLDAHVHVNVADPAFLEQARDDGFELMTINVDYPDFPKLADQRAAALAQLHADPARVHWATTFSMQGFGKAGWADKVNAGARGRCGAGREGSESLEKRGDEGEGPAASCHAR